MTEKFTLQTPMTNFNKLREVEKDKQPRVVDNDAGEILVYFNGSELRGWSYKDDAERRTKMVAAREYVEGWCDGRDARLGACRIPGERAWISG